MKKLLALLLLFKMSASQASADAAKATITCTVHNSGSDGRDPSGLFLYQLKDGQPLSLGFQRPDEQGNCSFNLDVKEGIYFFKRAGGHGHEFKFTIYVKAGDQKQVDFYLNKLSLDYDSCVITKPNAETKRLQAWLERMNKYREETRRIPLGSSLVEKYEQFQKAAASFLASNKTANTYFNTWMADKVYTDLQYVRAASFFRFGRLNASYDRSETVQSFYQPLSDKKIINDTRLLRSEHGMELLDYMFGYRKVMEGNSQDQVVANYFSPENAALIGNTSVKVAFLSYKMPGIKKYEDFVKHVQPYQNLFTTAKQKALYQKRYEELFLFAEGTPGYDFKLKDVNDKTYTLSGFKGKVVVIDMWAMWCAPCLAEKPIMEKIAEGYHGRNDIVFVGVSTDGLAKKEIWKAFVKKRGFTSIELLSNHTESIQKYYKIEGIPRFLIFDREGKIVTVDAPRPSDPEFKKLIEQTLKIEERVTNL